MANGKYLCYEDINGLRGYIPPQTSYTVRQINATRFWIESDTISALVDVGVNATCDAHVKDCKLGLMSDEKHALEWVVCGKGDQFIGGFKCPVPMEGS